MSQSLQLPKNSFARLLLIVYGTALLSFGCLLTAFGDQCRIEQSSLSFGPTCIGDVSHYYLFMSLVYLGAPILLGVLLKKAKITQPGLTTGIAYVVTLTFSIIVSNLVAKGLGSVSLAGMWDYRSTIAVGALFVVFPAAAVTAQLVINKKTS